MTRALPMPPRVRRVLEPVGAMYTMGAESLYWLGWDIVHRRFRFAEFVGRSWFLVATATLPAVLVSIPLGVAIVLQVGGLASQIGANSFV
ncbi:MAG: phospholipid/cholesterol/gamma-HCH transport system permease protein, partial [Pseudonocardiales bacterium]|nr:phospholipid/cholesterol/gamma-HCH transport system permease protein [Pseudonocardiales bacterium]